MSEKQFRDYPFHLRVIVRAWVATEGAYNAFLNRGQEIILSWLGLGFLFAILRVVGVIDTSSAKRVATVWLAPLFVIMAAFFAPVVIGWLLFPFLLARGFVRWLRREH